MRGKVLAIDYGRKAVGFASGDLELGLAFPRAVLRNRGVNLLVDEVLKVVAELEVVRVVVGMPSVGSVRHDIAAFVALLQARGLDVVMVDEDNSSVEAGQMFDRDGGAAGVGRMDANAAQVILQRYFGGECR